MHPARRQKRRRRWSPTEEIGWSRTQEIRWYPSQEIGWVRSEEILQEDTRIKFLTHWRAPFTGGGESTLPKGTQVRVKIPDWIREPIGVYADPIDVPRIERLLVSEDDRTNAKYGGFSLSISTADLNKQFRLVKGAPE